MTAINQLDLLANAIQATTRQHEVVSQNIANANTPGYKTQQIEFQQHLQKLADGEIDVKSELSLETKLEDGLEERANGNNVNLEHEIGKLKKNALVTQTLSHLIASRLATFRRSIQG